MYKRFLALLLALLMALTMTGCAKKEEPTAKDLYDQAAALLQTGSYTEASKAFSGMGHFLDAPKYSMYCDAMIAAGAGKYDTAASAFAALGDFLDSRLLAAYYQGRSVESQENYEAAMAAYEAIPFYADASERAAQMPAKALERDYKAAAALQDKKAYPAAIAAFQVLNGYSDSEARITAMRQQMAADAEAAELEANAQAYAAAEKLEADGNLAAAEERFRALGAYSDSAARADGAKYRRAAEAEAAGDVVTAYGLYAELGTYEDSLSKAEALQAEAAYLTALSDAEAGRYTQAAQAFAGLGSYKDSAEKARLLGVFALAGSTKKLNSGVYAFQMNDVWGYIDLNQNLDVSPQWASIGKFNKGGLAIVKTYGSEGCALINARGQYVLNDVYVDIQAGENGMFTAVSKAYNTYYFTLVDAQGTALSTWQRLGESYNTNAGSRSNRCYAYGPSFTNGLIFAVDNDGRWSMLDTAGNERISGAKSLEFMTRSKPNDTVIVGTKRGYQLCDLNGQLLSEHIWTSIGSFSEGYAVVCDSKGNYGYISKENCDIAIQPQYRDALAFSEGLAGVQTRNGWGFINTKGEFAIQPNYYSVSPFHDGYSTVIDYTLGYQVIAADGSLVYFKESVYQYANALDEAGDYERAITAFESLNGYADSDARALSARDKINAGIYARAEQLLASGKLDEAAEAFEWLGDYNDSPARAAAVRETINANAYAAAAALEENGQLKEAIVAFNALGDYCGSAAHAMEITETINNNTYLYAAELEENGWYEWAILYFNTVPTYRDSADRIAACEEKIRVRDYNAAAVLDEAGNYEEAIVAFHAMNGYSDSNDRIAACEEKIRVRDYNAASALDEAGRYEEAIVAFRAMNGYSDSTDRIAACEEKIRVREYNAAAALEVAGDYSAAHAAFVTLGNYMDAPARAEGVVAKAIEQQNREDYAAADALEQRNELEAAETAFLALGTYSDSQSRATTVRLKIWQRDYAIGVAHLKKEEYAQAAAVFTALGLYEDSPVLLQQAQNGIRYQNAVAAALSGQFADAYSEFVALGDFKDSAKKAEICGNLSHAGKMKQITDGVLMYEFHNLWGIANLNTNAITAAKYTEITYNTTTQYGKYNLLKVYIKGKSTYYDQYGYVDMNGREVIACNYLGLSDFNRDGLCTIAKASSYKDGRYTRYYAALGIADYTGKVVSSPKWKKMGNSESNKSTNQNSWYSYYLTIKTPQFIDGCMTVQNTSEEWGFIDQNGKVLGAVEWYSVGNFSDGMAMVSRQETTGSGYSKKTVTKYGFVNERGQTIGEVRWEKVNAFSNGYAAVLENGKWGFINKQNELVIPCQYLEVGAFKADGTCDVKTKEGTWQIINTSGEVSFFGK